MSNSYSRRSFLKTAGSVAAIGALPVTLVELAFAKPAQNFHLRIHL
jgi:TAT (twin-arginine translocation) pathway signal sequence